jgi:eukaryotic-like serine/threonine-protein kinase
METTRWHEVDRLFGEVLDRPPAERPAFLDSVCAGDAALRRDLERLLAADAVVSGFLGSSPEELMRLTLDDQEEGGNLGPYRLLRKIGSGGMGTVYLAHREDEHYERDVAVKILRSGLESTEAFHRFVAERQILARLEHPNIARLYDGGSTEDGRPYLVLELVEGLPVDEYCDRHRLTVDQRLGLFQKICSAVQHAHQNLLVHRDLKPANILVTPQGEPKLLDFGIAKRLALEADDTLHRTRIGLRLLTPRYASPEQVRGDAITTASDVYSLGVILYELLAGRSPYPLAMDVPYEMERMICEQEPERPSLALFRQGLPNIEETAGDPENPETPENIALARKTRPQALAHRLCGDLDNIVLMALRKEPQRRYGSAAQLAQDLEKHLQDLPVTARPDTLQYRARKFVRRHRAAVAVTAAACLLVAGSVTSLVAQGRQLEQERDKARYAMSFLVDTFKQADPYQTQGEKVTAREILDQGTARIAQELAGEPDVQAAVLNAIGEANLGLGRYAEAEPLLTRALALRRQIFGAGSLEAAESLEHLAECQSKGSSLEKAESNLREALAIRRRRQGDGDLALARTLNHLGQLLVLRGATPENASEIEALFQEALAIARRVEGPAGPTVAETLIKLADFRSEQGKYTEAEKLSREGLAVERKTLGDRDPRFYRDQSYLGLILVWAGKYAEAEALLRSCLEKQRALLGPAHPDAVETMHYLVNVMHYAGRLGEAEALNREALALVRSLYGPAHPQMASSLHNLGAVLAGQRRYDEAITLYNQSLEIRRLNGEEKGNLAGRTLLVLAELHRDQKKYSQALDFGHQALENFKRTRGPDHTDVAWPLYEIGRSYLAQNRFQEAESSLRRSLEIRLRRLEPGHIDVAKVQYLLAKCLIRQGLSDEAKPLLQKTRTTYAAVYGPDHESVQKVDSLLAEARSASEGRD